MWLLQITRNVPLFISCDNLNHPCAFIQEENSVMSRTCAIVLMYLVLVCSTYSRSFSRSPHRSVQELVGEAAKTVLEKFKDKGLKDENLSITLIDLRDPQQVVKGSFRGNERIYPASVI